MTADPTRLTITGNVATEPSMRFSKTGLAICSFNLAHRPRVPKGEPEGPTTFYRCVLFGSLGENALVSLQKGDRCIVDGRYEVEHWKTSQGEARVTHQLVADSCGPDLRFATTQIVRTERDHGRQPDPEPVPAAAPERRLRPPSAGYGFDEEPF